MEYLKLNTGADIPVLGFGVYLINDKEVCRQSVYDAIKSGYRLIDTAAVYTNEDAVGDAVRDAIADGLCKREDLFITSKLWVQDMDEKSAVKGIEASLKKSGLEYFDLYLLHQALRDYFGAWRSLESAYDEGTLKAIGVSNFYPNVIANFCETVRVIPAVNQIELHPWYCQPDALKEAERYGIVLEAWAPLGADRYDSHNDPLIRKIADRHGKTNAQVMLRWGIQRNTVVIPKSTHCERIIENFDVFDFELTDEEMALIATHDLGYGDTRSKHFSPDFARRIIASKIHD